MTEEKYITAKQVEKKLKITKRRLHYAVKKKRITDIEWNEKHTRAKYSVAELRDRFDLN